MKVLYLAPHSFYIDRGTPICVDYMVRSLSARGDEVHLVVYAQGRDQSYPGLTIHRTKWSGWLGRIGPGFSLKKLIADFFMFFVAWRTLRRARPDVVHAGEEAVFMAMFFRLVYRVPYIYDLDSSIAQQVVEKMRWLRPIAPVLNWFERRAVRRAVACAPVCNALGDLAEAHGAKYVERLHDISQLEEPGRAGTGFLREKLGLGDEPILMYVGNLETYQGLDLLLDALALSHQHGSKVNLVIAGGVPKSIAKYRAKASQLGIDGITHFLGHWPSEDLCELLAEADILTAPRISGLNTPMKVYPYMHSGRPVLVTDLPTHTQLLTNNEVMLGRPDPEGFAEAIDRLVNDADLRASLGAAGHAFVEANHTYRAHCVRLNRLYDHVGAEIGVLAGPDGAGVAG